LKDSSNALRIRIDGQTVHVYDGERNFTCQAHAVHAFIYAIEGSIISRYKEALKKHLGDVRIIAHEDHLFISKGKWSIKVRYCTTSFTDSGIEISYRPIDEVLSEVKKSYESISSWVLNGSKTS